MSVQEGGTEFWRDITPIEDSARPGSLPEVHLANAATDDERFYVPLTETVSTRPLWISIQQNRWCDILVSERAGLVNRHYHPHQVFAYTISGKMGLPRVRLGRGPRRLRLRDTRRFAHADRV